MCRLWCLMDGGEGAAREYHDEAIASEETSRRRKSHGHRRGSHYSHFVVSDSCVSFLPPHLCALAVFLRRAGESSQTVPSTGSLKKKEVLYHLTVLILDGLLYIDWHRYLYQSQASEWKGT